VKVLVNLIGGQTHPNFIASIQLNPDKIVLLHTRDSERQAALLRDALRRHRENFSFALKEIEPFDIESIYASCKSVAQENPCCELLLNYTGGTKQMSIGAYTAFKEANAWLIYVDTQTGKLYKNRGEEKSEESLNVPASDIETLLSLRGYEMDSSRNTNVEYIERRQGLTDFILNYVKNQTTPIAQLKNLLENRVLRDYAQKYQANLHSYWSDDNDRSNYFEDGKGGWLEEWVYCNLKNSGLFDDVKINVKVKGLSGTRAPVNEFDVLAAKNAVLYCFECKTGKYSPKDLIALNDKSERYAGRYGGKFFVCVSTDDQSTTEEISKLLNIHIYSIRTNRSAIAEFVQQHFLEASI
jgi:hypothetical protein